MGVIEHNKISFTWQGNRYEWTSTDPVVGSGGNWHLWVLHDAGYEPDFYPFAPSYPRNGSGESQAKSDTEPRLSSLDEALRKAKRRTQAEFKTQFPSQIKEGSRHAPRGIRISTGSTDRMENLLPKK